MSEPESFLRCCHAAPGAVRRGAPFSIDRPQARAAPDQQRPAKGPPGYVPPACIQKPTLVQLALERSLSRSTCMQVGKGYKGMGMEGRIAAWYARNTARDIPDFAALAQRVTATLPAGSRILEVAPGPGYLAIEIAR